MLKHKAEQISTGVKLLDILICIAAFTASYYFRGVIAPSLPGSLGQVGYIGSIESVSWLLAASLALHFVIYPYLGFYGSIRQKTITSLSSMVGKAMITEFFALGATVFLLQEKSTSRYFFILFLSLNYFSILASRLAAWFILSATRYRGYNFRRVLIVGTSQNALNVFKAIQDNPRWGYVVCGFLSAGRPTDDQLIAPENCLGTLADFEGVVRRQTVDEVIFALNYIDGAMLSNLNSSCYELGIPARFSLSFFEKPTVNVRLSVTQNIPFLSFYRSSASPLELFLKRAVDIFAATFGLLVTALLLPFIAIGIKRESPGPIFFSQPRVGENGRTFTCFKFRTMNVNAESQRDELFGHNEMQGPMFKVTADPRIFAFGSFLRRTSLDELPQFWNVLRGEMSLVGTRPPLLSEVDAYKLEQRRRLSIKPGLTGLWQVNGRSKIKRFEDIVALDLYYIDNWSLWLDLKIILKTIRVVLFREGAI